MNAKMYHATDAASAESIVRNGLIPSQTMCAGAIEENRVFDCVYAFAAESDAQEFASSNCLDVVLTIDVTDLAVSPDCEYPAGVSWRIEEDVPADRIADRGSTNA